MKGDCVMSKLNEIEGKINSLEPGAFQRLCDNYFYYSENKPVNSYGMKSGSNITIKGTPDSFFELEKGKYVFLEYTVQKEKLAKKIEEDINKCFNESKDTVQLSEIQEIRYFYSNGRLSSKEQNDLIKLCEEKGVKLSLYDSRFLASEIFRKYPILAKENLGITLDTGQIFLISEFIHHHNCKYGISPFGDSFEFRERELKISRNVLSQKDVLILSGAPGVGKTRFAIELCKEYEKENKFYVLCISGNGEDIYNDLVSYIDDGNDYLIFVDDANELSELSILSDFLLKKKEGKPGINKLILTVRDYAKTFVLDQFLNNSYAVLKLLSFSNEEIKSIIKKQYQIDNVLSIEKILDIAKGNIRFAILASQIIQEKGKIDNIQDLYRNYYKKQIHEIQMDDSTLVKSAGILAFLQYVRIDSLDYLAPIFNLSHITEKEFRFFLEKLHKYELIDICQNKVAKISDQNFRDYLLEYCFVDEKYLPLNSMIYLCFFIDKEKTAEAVKNIYALFNNSQEYIREHVKSAWDCMSKEDCFWDFVKRFYIFKPVDTLILLKDKIDAEPKNDVSLSELKTQLNCYGIPDDIIRILEGFSGNECYSEAIELLILYAKKKPELYCQFYQSFTEALNMDASRGYFNFESRKIIADKFHDALKPDDPDSFLFLFLSIAENYLRFDFSFLKDSYHKTIYHYTGSIGFSESMISARKRILKDIYNLYQQKRLTDEIENLLLNYGFQLYLKPSQSFSDSSDSYVRMIVKAEFDDLILFLKLFSATDIKHCLIAKHFKEIAEFIDNKEYDSMFDSFLNNEAFQIYCTLKETGQTYSDQCFGNEIEKFYCKTPIQRMMKEKEIGQFDSVLSVYIKAFQKKGSNLQELTYGLECALDVFSDDKDKYLENLKACLVKDISFDFYSRKHIFKRLFSLMSGQYVYAYILSFEFKYQYTWLWEFFDKLPENQITATYVQDFLKYLENAPSKLKEVCISNKDFFAFNKYEKIHDGFIIEASRIIYSHHDENPELFFSYFKWLFIDTDKARDKIKAYLHDIKLLENIYLKCVFCKNRSGMVLNGRFLFFIVKIDQQFLNDFLDAMLSNYRDGIFMNDCLEPLNFIWNENSYEEWMDIISNKLMDSQFENTDVYFQVVGYLIKDDRNEQKENKKQKWILHRIEMDSKDKARIKALFKVIINKKDTAFREKTICTFLQMNDDISFFENVVLQPKCYGGEGSMQPYIQKRIDYLESLLLILKGIKYLIHKKIVQEEIDFLKKQMKAEELYEFKRS